MELRGAKKNPLPQFQVREIFFRGRKVIMDLYP